MPDIFIDTKETKAREETLLKREQPHPHKMKRSSPLKPLITYAVEPEGVHFVTQAENEKIALFLRRHFITNIDWILLGVILLLLPPLLFPLRNSILPFDSVFGPNVYLILTLFYYLVVFGVVFLENFIDWFYNVYIVTNERMLDIDHHNLLFHEINSAKLTDIEEITTRSGGLLGSLFDFGDVLIEVPGTQEIHFDFHKVAKPQEVVHEIEELRRKEEA